MVARRLIVGIAICLAIIVAGSKVVAVQAATNPVTVPTLSPIGPDWVISMQSANSVCVNGKVDIDVAIKSGEPSGSQNDIHAKTSAEGVTIDLGNMSGGQTLNGVIHTGKTSVNAGSALFTLTWVNRSGSDSRTAQYAATGSCGTPTITSTPSKTPTLTGTPTLTSTVTPTLTSSWTPSGTPTLTNTPTLTPTLTSSWTPTGTPTLTNTPTLTPTLTSSWTPTGTPSGTPTLTKTPTSTITPPPPGGSGICVIDGSGGWSQANYTIWNNPIVSWNTVYHEWTISPFVYKQFPVGSTIPVYKDGVAFVSLIVENGAGGYHCVPVEVTTPTLSPIIASSPTCEGPFGVVIWRTVDHLWITPWCDPTVTVTIDKTVETLTLDPAAKPGSGMITRYSADVAATSVVHITLSVKGTIFFDADVPEPFYKVVIAK